MTRRIEIAGRAIGPGEPAFIIAEMSANHGGNIDHAKRVVREAAARGADAIKIQTYTAETLTIDSDAPAFRVDSGELWKGRRLFDLYREGTMPWEWQPELKRLADELGIILFSSPFDVTAIDFLEKMDVPCYKVASFELVDLPLVRAMARTGKPLILSTGMASLAEIHEAVEAARSEGNHQLALLKCNSAYPAPYDEMNLRTIPHLADAFGVPAGLSDHTMGNAVALASVALGACIIEKHFCLSRAEGGPDSAFSMEPHELQQLVEDVRKVEKALGRVQYQPPGEEAKNRAYRRSLFVVKDMKAGEVFDANNVRSIRPGGGLPPKHLPDVLGLRAARAISRGTPLSWDLVSGPHQ
jgi:pseudaminic acid synthase